MPRAQTRLQVSLEKREYHPNPDDSGDLLSPTDAPADLQALHHGEQLSCLEQCPPLQTTPAWVRAWYGWRKWLWIVPIWNCCPEVFPRNPSLLEGKGIQPLYLGGCQSGNWKVSFPHARILKKSQQIIILWQLYLWHSALNQTVVCLSLQSDHLFAYKLKNVWNENHNFTKIFRQRNTISFLT